MESGALYKMDLALYFIPLPNNSNPYKELHGYSYFLQQYLYLNKYMAQSAQPKSTLEQLLNSWQPLVVDFPEIEDLAVNPNEIF